MAEALARKILVTGATGQQGGAVVPNLVANGHRVRVMTRTPEKAKGLSGPSVEVVAGDFRNPESLRKALDGVDGAFLMGTPYEEGPAAEVAQGKAMIDACAAVDVGHVVYSSVCSANRKTGIPHFDSKHEIEEHLREAGLSFTILRPVWFMENFASPWYRPSIEKGVLSTPLRPDRPLQMVSVEDIGKIVAEMFSKPMKFVGREIDIAGDQTTMEKVVEEISRVLSLPVRYEQIPADRAEKAVGHDLARMFQWFNDVGYDVDLWMAQSWFKRYEIFFTTFRDYLERTRLGIGKAA